MGTRQFRQLPVFIGSIYLLKIIFEDKAAARETLDRVRTFIKNNPTVYLSTHCPEGYENLEMKRVMKL